MLPALLLPEVGHHVSLQLQLEPPVAPRVSVLLILRTRIQYSPMVVFALVQSAGHKNDVFLFLPFPVVLSLIVTRSSSFVLCVCECCCFVPASGHGACVSVFSPA